MAATRPGRGIRARLRGRLGGAAGVARAAVAAAAVGAGAGAAAAAGRRALVAARGETARRLGRLAALTVVLAALVMVLYDHGDVPTAAARGAAGLAGGPAAASGGTAAAPGGTAAGRKASGESARPAGAQARPAAGRADAGAAGRQAAPGAAGERPVKRSAKPAEVAAAWYAARHNLPRSRVRPLQQDRIAAGQVRVLVLAEASGGRLRTALVRVQRGPSGWEVR